jgi:peptide/nickel transport system substrate-binding protein
MLVIGKAADPQTLDPAVTIDNNDWTVTYPAYQRLVKYKTQDGKGSTDVEGDLSKAGRSLMTRKVDLSLHKKCSLTTARRSPPKR